MDDPLNMPPITAHLSLMVDAMYLNAAGFGFELSYPRNNLRGVHYEPWHWRFVGTPVAGQIFAK